MGNGNYSIYVIVKVSQYPVAGSTPNLMKPNYTAASQFSVIQVDVSLSSNVVFNCILVDEYYVTSTLKKLLSKADIYSAER